MTENPKSFADDLFARSQLADNLIDMLYGSLYARGRVIAIDAPWGDGKTYFARNLNQRLCEKQGYPILIDAFACDYYDDPFALLTSAIYSRFKNSGVNTTNIAAFKQKTASVAKRLIPTMLKVMLSGATAGWFNSKVQEETAKAIADCLGTAASGIIEEQIENFEDTCKSIEEFKELLATLAQECVEKSKTEEYPEGLPLVVIIDELDRCRPTFALTLLERVKHFFDIKNVVFILMANKSQLTEYIKGMYGTGVNADLYLEKFIDLSINLPSLPINQLNSNSLTYAEQCLFARSIDRIFDPDGKMVGQEFRHFLKTYCAFSDVPLRSIEKYYNYISFVDSNIRWDNSVRIEHVAILILLKLLRPSLYNDFLYRDAQVTEEVLELMTGRIQPAQQFKVLIEAIIKCHVNQNDDPTPYCTENPSCAAFITQGCSHPGDAFFRAAQYIDFVAK